MSAVGCLVMPASNIIGKDQNARGAVPCDACQ
jgi:hypothetical protein